MTRYGNLDRPPLHEAALARALVRPGGLWQSVRVVEETGSTNADLGALARAGEDEGVLLATELQTAGRGRLGRTWTAPARSGLAFSMLLRPDVPIERLAWAPLLTGVAVASAVRRVTGFGAAGDRFFPGADGDTEVAAVLKWPNDVLVEGRKLAGILVEKIDGAIVVGVGLNVSLSEDELPVPAATSLAIEGAPLSDRASLLRAIARDIEGRYREWVAASGDPDICGLRADYRDLCATLGREIRVELPGGAELHGHAKDVDLEGRLVVAGPEGVLPVSAGDVVHVR
ncbi:biotin--[acetyl-CoA-carboxylase] ligase [Actinomadura harenae]|uniref:biotin--[acetyl-CoA-carboxylase] ligase n=1 Tax=Actinomadura harenae TaxID=2483351 RepID=UPI001F219F88|nr:biotin--[acetyl-CoA-carboxylase] ligase [Actinomadura harenae]